MLNGQGSAHGQKQMDINPCFWNICRISCSDKLRGKACHPGILIELFRSFLFYFYFIFYHFFPFDFFSPVFTHGQVTHNSLAHAAGKGNRDQSLKSPHHDAISTLTSLRLGKKKSWTWRMRPHYDLTNDGGVRSRSLKLKLCTQGTQRGELTFGGWTDAGMVRREII